MPATSTFSLRLDAALKERLETAAKSADRSAAYIATQAIKAFLNAEDTKRQAIEEAIADADKGRFISSSAMNEWVDSWTDEETVSPSPMTDIGA